MSVEDLPQVNAALNGFATLFLLAGWWAIKVNRDERLHRTLMVTALACSTLFLGSYLYYHYNAGAMTPFQGEGVIRYVYYAILITHVPLATLMVPFIFAAVYFAIRRQFRRHTMITRYLWPVWIYVSVTGVLIYIMLYEMY